MSQIILDFKDNASKMSTANDRSIPENSDLPNGYIKTRIMIAYPIMLS